MSFMRIATGLSALYAGILISAPPASAQAAPDEGLVSKGAYVARLGDCVACHTAVNGKAFAGGLPIKTPVGTIYSTNITPDKTHGIGSYTLEEFGNAVRKGIRKDGRTMYPAMPFPAFSRMTDEDIKYLYAYFMNGVQAEPAANKPSGIPWPLSARWPLAVWRAVFAPSPKPFQIPPGADPVIARGAYLVEGPGHCGMCHTPRGAALQEKALTASDGPVFLSGGAPVDNWIAPSLRNDPVVGIGRWTEDDIVLFLRSGRTDHTAVFGGMADVVGWSTQYFSDEDLRAIAKYLKNLPPVPPAKGEYVYDDTATNLLDSKKTSGNPGADVYAQQCAICHRNDGGGVARMFPPLAGNSVVMTDDPLSVIHIILAGGVLPPTNYAPSSVAMPGYDNILTDKQVADVSNFIRTAWGNKGLNNVSEAEVKKLRGQVHTPTGAAWATDTTTESVWSLMAPQPYGRGWTFMPATHTGQDTPQ